MVSLNYIGRHKLSKRRGLISPIRLIRAINLISLGSARGFFSSILFLIVREDHRLYIRYILPYGGLYHVSKVGITTQELR